MMSKTLRSKDGKFAGSLGTGMTPPQPASKAARARTMASSSRDAETMRDTVSQSYEAFSTVQRTVRVTDSSRDANTYPARLAAYIRAQSELAVAEAQRDRDLDAAGGRAFRADQCASCSHGLHTGACSSAVQLMSDVYETCRCPEGQAPTADQVKASESARLASLAYLAANAARTASEELQHGDAVVVARGRKVPKGVRGSVIRTHNGSYGLRVLLSPSDGGEPVWVTAANLDRQV